jgi:orotidine-5'-phosphate decarboxylase
MLRAARQAADEESARRSGPRPLLIAVTVLTSFNNDTLAEVGFRAEAGEQVVRLAALAQAAGLDGVVASPQEIAPIRRQCGQSFAIVTPGIRATGAAKGDQARTMSAPEALAAGAAYLVVGRPITAAPDPRAAADQLIMECRVANAS